MPVQVTLESPFRPMKRRAPSRKPWTQKFFKVVPLVDANGKPVPQDPPLNKEGFWKKPDLKKADFKKAVNVESEEQ